MTYEELKTEAEKLGYKLIKKQEYIRFLPCTCGCNVRHHHTIPPRDGHPRLYFYKCSGCFKEGPKAKTERDAKIAWNKMIEEETKNGR